MYYLKVTPSIVLSLCINENYAFTREKKKFTDWQINLM